ncbi:MAG TPA: TIGR03790 family protein [Burkholderiaceae bacterium]|nr:TIGR03790 family protein [Burkholderiaceae bacterium]
MRIELTADRLRSGGAGLWLVVAVLLCGCGVSAQGKPPAAAAARTAPPASEAAPSLPSAAPSPSASPASPASAARAPAWIAVPRIAGRLTSKDLGLVINTADPYSVEVGEFYIRARKLAPEQVLRIELPVRARLTPDEFRAFDRKVSAYFGTDIQALALAWVKPFAVACNSITAALGLGFDGELCERSCEPPLRFSPYFNSATARPYTDLGLRLSMLLAADDVAGAKAMIERGVASDHTLGLRGGPPVNAWFVITPDRARSSRAVFFPPPGRLDRLGIDVHVEKTTALEDVDRVVLYLTGLVRVAKLDTIGWVPGGVGDHLTSTGGILDGSGSQMSATAWIASGATASYGTVSEPCSHPQKFPFGQVLLLQYAQGASVIEAYWKSVAWPQQGVFIGEPLAAPFARR